VSAAKATVYIVDDDPSVRQALARVVRSAGLTAETFGTVLELISQAVFTEPACVVSDIGMAETSGLELPRQFATRGRALPVIFVTAYDTEENRAAAKRAGAAAFFHKPVDGQALLDAVAWAVAQNASAPDSRPR
jgi:FixJ family two-component response regulator